MCNCLHYPFPCICCSLSPLALLCYTLLLDLINQMRAAIEEAQQCGVKLLWMKRKHNNNSAVVAVAAVPFTMFIIRSKPFVSVGLFFIIVAMISWMTTGITDWLIVRLCKGVILTSAL